MNYQTMTLANREYVLVPKKDFLTFDKKKAHSTTVLANDPFAGAVRALPFAIKVMSENLRAARELSGLTQGELAERLECSQTMVSLAEKGKKHVGKDYVVRVLSACGLPANWQPSSNKIEPRTER